MAEEFIVKLARWIHTGLAFVREKLSLILPPTKFLGFLDLTTIILIIVSLIISYLILKRGITGIRAMPWIKFLLIAGGIFVLLKFA